jgi:hypothetical protein
LNKSALAFKKRLMFLKGEDLYFLAYNTIVLLQGLSCISKDKPLFDYSKIALLIDFVADSRLARVITTSPKNSYILSESDKHILQSSYTEGLMRRHIVARLIFALEKRGILSLEINKEKEIISVFLKEKGLPHDFFNTNLYETEFENIVTVKKYLPTIRTMKLETMITRLYTDNGVLTWHI